MHHFHCRSPFEKRRATGGRRGQTNLLLALGQHGKASAGNNLGFGQRPGSNFGSGYNTPITEPASTRPLG
jgi:hypothetical protein